MNRAELCIKDLVFDVFTLDLKNLDFFCLFVFIVFNDPSTIDSMDTRSNQQLHHLRNLYLIVY
jgi:hypothetical protein